MSKIGKNLFWTYNWDTFPTLFPFISTSRSFFYQFDKSKVYYICQLKLGKTKIFCHEIESALKTYTN